MTAGSVRRYSVREKEIAAKVFDEEVIIINLATNIYFSFRATGHQVWQMLDAGWSFEEMAHAFAEIYDIDDETVCSDVGNLIDELLHHGLVEADPARTRSQDFLASADGSGYTPPNLECYTDMQDLLALDPPLPKVV